MAYIGRQLARGENRLFDDISGSFNGSTTTFNLTISSVATSTATPFQLFVSLGGVMQKPNTDFTTAGNQITFTTAPAAGLSCWMMMQGDTIDSAAISDASVTPSKIAGSNFAFSGDLRLNDADSSNYVGFKAPTTVSSNLVWTLPAADTSVSGYVLASDGSGNLSWVEAGDSSSPSFTGDVTLTNDGSIVGFSSLHGTYTGSVKTYTVTVASKTAAHRYNGQGSGNGYKINGKEAPFLTLTPGRTYKFDQSDGSNSGHPFRFYLEANKTTAFTTGVTTNGTPGSSGAYTQIVVSDTTPQVLHYQCSAHGYMGNAVQANSNVAAAGSLNGSTLASGITASSLTSVGTLGSLAVTNNVTVGGNLTVSGTTTTVDSVTLSVKDKNIEMGVVDNPSDTTADGGGITLKGAQDHTFNWINATDAWTSSEHIHLIDNKKLFVGGASGTTDGLEIVHNGSNSIINDSGTGTLQLQTGGSTKLEIQSGGINVTGAINVNGSALSTAPEVTATASGAIAANKAVIVNSNGTISEAGESTSPAALTEIGEALNNTSENVDPGDIIWINNTTFIAAWQQSNDNNYAYVIAGSISGSTVTLGSKVAVSNNNDPIQSLRLAVDRTNETFLVIGYNANGSDRYIRGGRISSGTTISMGSPDGNYGGNSTSTAVASDDNGGFMIAYWNSQQGAYKFEHVQINSSNNLTHSSEGEFTALSSIINNNQYADLAYDKNQSKYFFVASNIGNDLKGCWVTSNGTGSAPTVTATNFNIGDSILPDLSWDDNANQFILTQRKHDGTDWKPNAVVLTPSGTNAPSIGTQFVMEDISTSNIKSTYVKGSNKVAVIRSGTSSIKISILNINGTTLSSYSITTIDNLDRTPIAIHSHETDNRIVSVFRDDSSSYSARFEVWDVPAVSTNLTSENFIGFAPSAISNSASGTVAVTGNTSTQSGLTAGQKYHLQQDGTLSTTSVSTSVEAGIALSSTKLLIKG